MAVNPSAKSNYLSKVQINGGTYWVKDAELRELLESAATKEAITEIITEGAGANVSNDTIPTSAALVEWLEQQIQGLTGAMHFAGVTDPEAGDTPEERLDDLDPDPEAGDIAIDGTAEYVYDGTEWKELGDEGIYATKGELEDAVEGIEIAGVALGSDKEISDAELIEALGLGDLAFKDDASGTIVVPTAAQSLNVAKAGEYSLAGTAISVPQTFSAMDVANGGTVALTQSTQAAAQYQHATGGTVQTISSAKYDKVDADVAISAAAPTGSEVANYTPAGSVSLPSFSGELSLAEDSVPTVTDAGTAYSLAAGSVSQAADTKSAFASEGMMATIDATDSEMLVFSAAQTAQAVTASGAVSYTDPVLSGSLPTFGSKDVVIKNGSSVAVSANGAASFAGSGVLIKGAASTSEADVAVQRSAASINLTEEAADATMTQPAFTAAFTPEAKTATPSVATSANAAPADATVTIASEDQSFTLATETKTVTVQ